MTNPPGTIALSAMLLAACLCVTGLAQASPVTSEVPLPGPDQIIAKTREGCGLIIPRQATPEAQQQRLDFWRRTSWLGVCANGLPLGPGSMVFRDEQGHLISLDTGWRMYGLPIGLGKRNAVAASDRYASDEYIYWADVYYYRNVKRAEPLEPPPDSSPFSPSVGFISPAESIHFKLLANCTTNGKRTACIEERRTGKSAGTFHYPCQQDTCGARWVQKAGPLIAGFDEFLTKHIAEITAAEQSVEPVLAPLRAQRERELEEAKALEAARAATEKRKAEAAAAREQAVAQANLAGKPVSSPNLNQLIRQAMGGGK